jgi:hypothetical protein
MLRGIIINSRCMSRILYKLLWFIESSSADRDYPRFTIAVMFSIFGGCSGNAQKRVQFLTSMPFPRGANGVGSKIR